MPTWVNIQTVRYPIQWQSKAVFPTEEAKTSEGLIFLPCINPDLQMGPQGCKYLSHSITCRFSNSRVPGGSCGAYDIEPSIDQSLSSLIPQWDPQSGAWSQTSQLSTPREPSIHIICKNNFKNILCYLNFLQYVKMSARYINYFISIQCNCTIKVS